MARKNWKPGNFFAVPLSEDDFGFGRVIRFPLVAIYDARHPAVLSPEELSGKPVLWKLMVYRYTISSARWPIIGHRELEPDLAEQVLFFKQDFFTQETEIYHEDGKETPATTENVSASNAPPCGTRNLSRKGSGTILPGSRTNL